VARNLKEPLKLIFVRVVMYDLIIVSQSSPTLIPVTQLCIDSARSDNTELNIIVVETGQPYKYDVDKIIEYNGQFNYNRALNLGLKYKKGDIHILANNDIIFQPGWSIIGEQMKTNCYHSASVLSQDARQRDLIRGDVVYEGYEIGKYLTGWCIFLDDYCLEKIGELDETCTFWYSDDLYACQLQSAGIKHGLFCNIEIDHIISKTLSKQPRNIIRQYQTAEYSKFNLRKQYYATRERVY
jgi:glycosyltransferase involved in cell wall biosynthesis